MHFVCKVLLQIMYIEIAVNTKKCAPDHKFVNSLAISCSKPAKLKLLNESPAGLSNLFGQINAVFSNAK